MIKEKRILSYFLGWLILGFIICIVGLKNVNANTIDYENIGMLSNYTLFYSQDTGSIPEFRELTQYEYYNLSNVSAFLLDINTFEFKSATIYDLEVYMPANSVKNNVKFIVTDANYNQCTTYELFIEDEHYPRFRFSCPSDTTGIDLYIFNDSEDYVINNGNFSWHYTYLRKQVSSVDLGPIIDQNNQIIQGQEDIKDAIIDSNKETQDVIKDQFNSCHQSVNLAIVDTAVNNRVITDILPVGTYTFSLLANNGVGVNLRLTNGSGEIIGKISGVSGRVIITFTLNEEGKVYLNGYIIDSANGTFSSNISEIQVEKGDKFTQYEKPGEQICSNKIDETNKELGNINDALTDDSPTDMSGLEDSIGWLPPGPVDSILNLPLSLFNSLSNNLSNKTCTSVELELPFINKIITLPCVKTLYDKMGVTGTLFQTTGIIASCFILFNYLLGLYHWVDNTLTLRENTMPGYYDDNWGGGA